MQSYESLSSIPQDKLAALVGGKFHLTKLISLRLRDVYSGAPFLLEPLPNEAKLATICREIDEGLISLEIYEHQEPDDEDGDFDILGIEDELGL